MTELAETATVVFMQPITLCNLDCSYCYLPHRAASRRMSPDVADAVARAVLAWSDEHPVRVVWHGGEPLAVGTRAFRELIDRFRSGRHRVSHAVQTNATLIDDAWCEVFSRHRIRVSVSLDGPQRFNRARTTRGGQESFDLALRGIGALRDHRIPFAAIAVVENPDADRAGELYDWFVELGCRSLGVNIAERKGTHAVPQVDDERVTAFWSALLARWRDDRRMHIREFDHVFRYLAAELSGRARERTRALHDPMPMITWDGEVNVLGPDLAGFSSPRLGPFTVGNVADAELTELVRRASDVGWVREALTGLAACRTTCDHYTYCLGGQPANKYFETGRFDVTETAYCRNSRKRLMEGLIRGV
ncbi:cyclophane-forming radical SAM peptide maturase AmcB [Streptomyces olivochromogenes]|uniref:cyclophane-forming radical SAM peptide maturase AmcB n=1 Tax=Streptomyces olivochromogenes TaxID=1963 RepID=UPI001F326531|nr:cyclophane-forming radical SAM peptide maturase AmcB [Streptomyces olivochromogenes]MCF3130032.1 radical SAM protein [Streptomyces olivochromogenes]